jgi:4-amino-4-deoxy-L-arabinose transferase-like glycosyltransferase
MSEVQHATDAEDSVTQRAPRAHRRIAGEVGSAPRAWLFTGASVLVGLWAVFQNFYKIGVAPILADEPTYIIAAQRYWTGNLWAPRSPSAANYLGATPDNFEHPPLVKFLFGLAQWVDDAPHSLAAPRAMSALATVLAAGLVAVWVGRIAGKWTGLLAGALLTVIPETASDSMGRFDRFAMLDPVASAFMVLSVVVAWYWSRRTGRAAWVWAAATGVAIGLASGSKENGFLGAVGPVLLVLILALIGRDRRDILSRVGQAVVAAVFALGTFGALYLPFPHPIARIRYLLAFQTGQSSGGHVIGFAGRVSAFPPWWANFWFAGHNYGSYLSAFIVVGALCAVVLRRDRLVAWCVAAMAGPIIFHCFLANVALGYYWVMWTPMLLVLAALGSVEVIRRVAAAVSSLRPAVPIAILAGVAVLGIPATESVWESYTVADIQPTGVTVVPSLMDKYDLHGAIVTAGVPAWDFEFYTPKSTVYYTATQPVTDAKIIVVGQPVCRQLIDQSVRALVKVNLATGHVKQIYSDSQIIAYAVDGSLTLPTKAQINAEPPGKLTDHC